jgi:hypothetical protein
MVVFMFTPGLRLFTASKVDDSPIGAIMQQSPQVGRRAKAERIA